MIHFDEGKFTTNPGSPIRKLYSAKVEKDGSVILTEVGEENIQDKINAALESTDIATIVAYYNQTGDDSVLNRYIPVVGDFSELPDSLAGFLQLRVDSENFFNALPVEVRKEFDNDPNKFFAQAGQKEWIEKLGPVLNPDKTKYPAVDLEVNRDVEVNVDAT